MSTAPPSVRDPKRLRALRRTALLDSAAEESFDRLTRLAARMLRVPVALISLVDEDRQFFKSQCGLPEPWASMRETPLSHSFCQHALETARPLVIRDARVSPLVMDNLAIPDLQVIAYAGIPLITAGGESLGSFCVIDHQPRDWSEEEIEVLTDLAGSVLSEIELRLEARARQEVDAERQRLIEQLRSEQVRLQNILLESPAAIGLLRGPEHVLVMANPPFLQLIGFRDVLEKPVREAFPELEGQPFFRLLDRVYRSGEPFLGTEFPARWDRTGNGRLEESFLNFAYQPIFAADGTVEGILIHAVEVTEQVLARQQVEKLAAERDAILRQIAEGVIVTDREGRITFVNEAARHIHGLDMADVGVEDYASAYHLFTLEGEPYPSAELPLSRAVLHDETTVDAEWVIRRPDGTEVIAQGSASPVLDEEGNKLGAVLTLRDITEQRQMERQRAELLDARDRAQAQLSSALEMRSRFFATLSHELRTPVNAVLSYLDMLLSGIYGGLEASQEDALRRCERAAKHLLELVSDILDISKLEAGKLEVQIEPVRLSQLVTDLFATMDPLARERGSELRLQIRGEPGPVRTDPRRVRQILMNLLSNAVKFGRSRPVEVRCVALPGGGAAVEVTDQGSGIASEDLPRIFEDFVQLESGETQPGTGLGLAISRRLAELLGGRLEAQSRPGEGSTFRLVLPAEAPGGEPPLFEESERP